MARLRLSWEFALLPTHALRFEVLKFHAISLILRAEKRRLSERARRGGARPQRGAVVAH